jgi:hypothetical protein
VNGTKTVPVIVVSAFATVDSTRIALEAGASAFVGKPVSLARLSQAIEGLQITHPVRVEATVETPDEGIDFGRLLLIGSAGKILPKYADDLERDLEAIELLLESDLDQTLGRIHTLRNTLLLAGDSAAARKLKELESIPGDLKDADEIARRLASVRPDVLEIAAAARARAGSAAEE